MDGNISFDDHHSTYYMMPEIFAKDISKVYYIYAESQKIFIRSKKILRLFF